MNKTIILFSAKLLGIFLTVYSYPFLTGEVSFVNFICFVLMCTTGVVIIGIVAKEET